MPDYSQENSVEIQWNKISVRQWRELVRKSGKSNLLQSWPYAQAILITERMTGQFATISYKGRIVGICQVLEQRLMGLFQKVRLYRGPLWLEQALPDCVYEVFWKEIRTRYPARPWRFTYFLPELPDTSENRHLLEEAGFKRIDTEGYSSIWLDLSQEEEVLRANLKSNWRNPLNQSLKKGLTLEIDTEGKHLNWLLKLSETDKLLKEFRGPSPALVAHLKRFTKDRDDMLLLRALDGNTPIGAVLIFLHEAGATYLVGWNSPAGRGKRAHNFLIWHSIMELKKRQVNWLDLGGINPQDAAGVTTFKRGIGGEEFTLVGSYT
ncbi:peptidoglycan bridge formation glycyltransferase FemA/FemB family protein [Kiloniella laminariae]|uniref:Peptidoglycan bridge formation glycyltransferase FemA/FemB family protein n=1 Tax=Kiloniella laminariae TaxID=454162 RepID=A0ABT4LNQ7_9PROT|nr:GNAT family N-acetyltransferase [Kiloniella laminariae]MCZ4282739.1 peptidoglycan bridge formation glycyltransferase FemA/FemB family protein [Kiloniella laminariae]